MVEERLWLASRNLKDDAREWFRQVTQDEYPAWRRFTELLQRRFKPTPRPNPLHRLSLGVDNCLPAEMTAQLDRLRVRLEKDRERRAAVRLQAAARGLLARRRAQGLRATKASKNAGELHIIILRSKNGKESIQHTRGQPKRQALTLTPTYAILPQTL